MLVDAVRFNLVSIIRCPESKSKIHFEIRWFDLFSLNLLTLKITSELAFNILENKISFYNIYTLEVVLL